MKKNFKFILFYSLLVSLLLHLGSCSQDIDFDSDEINSNSILRSESSISNPWKNNPYKVNVIYFIPNDLDTLPNYNKRLSEIMLHIQAFYGENLQRAGFGNTSFGLDLLSNERVNIHVVKGKQGKDAYPYDGGKWPLVTNEVDEYYQANPGTKKSEHTLIIIPTYNSDDLNPGGPPFYGVGKTCFALDYPDMDVKYFGQANVLGDLATKWIGGLAHELGHGLNAPHNKEHKSERNTLGTALMGSGNYTYGKNPTFITNAMCAIFANSQTFSTQAQTNFWYQSVQHSLDRLKGEVANNKIIVSGKFSSSKKINQVVLFLDPDGGGDYDALGWTTTPNSDNNFNLECPVSELYSLDGKYELKLRFICENGTHIHYAYNLVFSSGIPNIEIINTKDLADRSSWTVIGQDSQEYDGLAQYILDNNRETVWHTQWRSAVPAHPHYFIVDTGITQKVSGLAFSNRNNLNGCIKDFELFGSNDNQNWTSLGNYTLKSQTAWQYVDITNPQSFRYLKLATANSHGNFAYAHLAEFAIY